MRVLLSRKLVVFGLVIILLLLVAVIFAPLLTPYDPVRAESERDAPAAQLVPPAGDGRPRQRSLTRLLYGARISLLIGLVVVISSAASERCWARIAGYYERWLGSLVMRVMDAVMASR